MDIHDIDINAIADRYERAFRREPTDRPVFNISYQLGKTISYPPTPPTIREQWFNFDWRMDCAEKNLENTGFLCEGFPTVSCNLGPDILAGYTGSELVIESTSTNWARFRVSDWSKEPPITFQKEGFYWKETERFLKLSCSRGKGRWLTWSGDLHTNGDGLAALRNPQNLLLDLYDCPDEIHRRMKEMHRVFEQVLEATFAITLPGNQGLSSSWCVAAARGRFAAIQNDFCCMVGREMFDEFFKAYVEKEASLLDHSIYHLDGPGAIQHIESICESPHLDVIQWVPGAGQKPTSQWPELMQKIQALGKGLWIHGSPRDQLEILKQVKPEGCMYNLGFPNRDEAEAWVREADTILKAKCPVCSGNTRRSPCKGI